jgi:two-component system, OmpR family, sensor histidine kinase SenX3
VHPDLLASSLPQGAWIGIAGGALVLGLLVGRLVGGRSGKRALAQRLISLGSRLGAEPPADDLGIEGALSYLENVTGAATEAVTESSAEAIRLRRSLDTLQLGLVLCDESGTVVYRNEMASTMMASRQGDVLAAQAVTELLAQAWDKGGAERTIDLYGPPRRALAVRAVQIDDGRRALGVLAVIEDVTERRRLDDVRRDFIANVSHELKTPMGAMGLLAETLVAEKDRDVAKRLAERIHTEAFRVSRIIDDLLDLSRLESELERPDEPVSVNLAMIDAVERVRNAADHARVQVQLSEPETPVTIRGSAQQLVSAMHALLENAIAYAPEDSVVSLTGTVLPAGELVEGSYTAANGRAAWRSGAEQLAAESTVLRLAVADHGQGIPATDLERIFERFYRVDRGRSRETGGTGLGLSIVRHVAVNHGGAVEVESREGEGSCFTLLLPVEAEGAA